MKETLTPWSAEVEYISAERRQKTGNSIIYDANGKFLIVAPTEVAARIVSSVNQHDALVKVLKACLDEMIDCGLEHSPNYRAGVAVLAAAGEKP